MNPFALTFLVFLGIWGFAFFALWAAYLGMVAWLHIAERGEKGDE